MCETKDTIIEFLKEEKLLIDAPITQVFLILRRVLTVSGFRDGVDMIQIGTQYENQFTSIEITKTVPYCNMETGEQKGEVMRYFSILLPDRYVKSTHHRVPKEAIIVKSIEDVQTLF